MVLDLTILVALIVGLTELVKRTGILPERFIPVVALVAGIGLNFGATFLGKEYGDVLLGGLIAGLTACGLYSGVKKTITG